MRTYTGIVPPSGPVKLEEYHSPLMQDVVGLLRNSHQTLERDAEQAGVSIGTLSKWLNDKVHRPRIDTLEKVAASKGYRIGLLAERGKQN